jgi:hypothetical protein
MEKPKFQLVPLVEPIDTIGERPVDIKAEQPIDTTGEQHVDDLTISVKQVVLDDEI